MLKWLPPLFSRRAGKDQLPGFSVVLSLFRLSCFAVFSVRRARQGSRLAGSRIFSRKETVRMPFLALSFRKRASHGLFFRCPNLDTRAAGCYHGTTVYNLYVSQR